MRQERAKIHLRAFTISKIFRGLYPGPPVVGGGRPSRTHPQHGFAKRPGSADPDLVCSPCSLTPIKREILEITWLGVFHYLIHGFHGVRVD
jgi:hypothetical protein